MLFLTILGPGIFILYLSLDHFGYIDKLTGQDILEESIERLQNTHGYPYTYIFKDSSFKKHFDVVFNIIRKNSKFIRGKEKKLDLKALLNQGHKPDLIVTAGLPIKIEGLIDNYPQEDKYFYSDNHPILLVFNSRKSEEQVGKGGKVCTIGNLKEWSKERKLNHTYIIGGIGLTIFTTAIAILQINIT